MATPQQDLDTIFAAWNQWVTKSNVATTDDEIKHAFTDFVNVVEPIAVANGHPAGVPKRKLG